MNVSLDTLLDIAGIHAKTVLIDFKMRALTPTWVLFNETGDPMIVGTPWKDDRDKYRSAKLMRQRMRAQGVIAYSFVAEAWTATVHPEEIDEANLCLKDPMRRPVYRQDREEIVSACAATASEIKWRQWTIVRDHLERIIRLEPRELPESAQQAQGWLTEMLK